MGKLVTLPRCEWCGEIGAWRCKVCKSWTCEFCFKGYIEMPEENDMIGLQCLHDEYVYTPSGHWYEIEKPDW